MKLFRFSCLPVKAHGFVLEYPGQSAHFIHEAVIGSVTVTGFSGKQIAVPDTEDVNKRQVYRLEKQMRETATGQLKSNLSVFTPI